MSRDGLVGDQTLYGKDRVCLELDCSLQMKASGHRPGCPDS